MQKSPTWRMSATYNDISKRVEEIDFHNMILKQIHNIVKKILYVDCTPSGDNNLKYGTL